MSSARTTTQLGRAMAPKKKIASIIKLQIQAGQEIGRAHV